MKYLWCSFILVTFFGCTQQQAPDPGAEARKMAEQNKALLMKLYDAINADDWTSIGAIIPENAVDHNPNPGQGPGLEGIKAVFAEMRKAFPDMKMTPQQTVAEGEFVTARILFTGTQNGEFFGMPASGKSVSVEGFDLIRFENGKAVERWGTFDNMGMMAQLGMTPGAESPNPTGK